MWENIAISALTVALTVLTTVAGTSWRMRGALDKRDAALLKMMSDHELADARRFSEVHARVADSAHMLVTSFGDTGRALREQVHLVELANEREKTNNLREFIRRDSFFAVVKSIDARFDRIDDFLHLPARPSTGADG